MRPHHMLSWLLLPVTALAIVACSDTKAAVTDPVASVEEAAGHVAHNIVNEKDLTADQHAYLGRLRNAVTKFRSADEMVAREWSTIIPCRFKKNAGGQGVHYINVGMVSQGIIDELQPSILMYETQKNGKTRLIGVEWGVPLVGETPPEIHGLPFHKNLRDGLWVLHIWMPENNPSGMFADWNPNVSCANNQPADEIT